MRKNFGAKTWLYPMPVFIVASYDENGVPNAMNAAWGGIYDTNLVMICLDESHKTTANIKASGAFTVSFATDKTVVPCDYLGIVSGNDVPDKLEKSGFHTFKSKLVNAPIIEELPMTLECKLRNFNEDGICIGEIVNVSADESILDEDGNIDVCSLAPVIYDPVKHDYISLGFSFKVGKAFKDGKQIVESGKPWSPVKNDDENDDKYYKEALEAVFAAGKASTSLLQRKLGVGYGRSARLIDRLEAEGIVGPYSPDGNPRELLVTKEEYEKRTDASKE